MTTLVALIGDPVSGSVSPQMHRAGFREAGLDWDYQAVRVEPNALPGAFPRLRSTFAGLNLTRPLKEAVLPLLDRVSDEAARAGSVNTVVFGDQAWGHSTDGAGFVSALRRQSGSDPRRAVVMGTGGAARAVSAALAGIGCQVTVWGRNERAGQALALDLGVAFSAARGGNEADLVRAVDLLVNATPVGGLDSSPEALPIPKSWTLHSSLTVFDLVYRPRRTALLRRAEAAGCRTVEGIEMLIEQGALSFALWTGRPGPVDAMRGAAYAAVEAEPAGSGGPTAAAAGGVR
jgi:shikimate dehydrogenase